MGGRAALTVAGLVPDRVAAATSFHGGGLVTDGTDSPHLRADQIQAVVYVGGAENDASFTDDHAEQLEKALTAAGVEHKIETYAAGHGYAVPDNGPYDADAAERHWTAMREVFGGEPEAARQEEHPPGMVEQQVVFDVTDEVSDVARQRAIGYADAGDGVDGFNGHDRSLFVLSPSCGASRESTGVVSAVFPTDCDTMSAWLKPARSRG